MVVVALRADILHPFRLATGSRGGIPRSQSRLTNRAFYYDSVYEPMVWVAERLVLLIHPNGWVAFDGVSLRSSWVNH
jgi:hypothetical protein